MDPATLLYPTSHPARENLQLGCQFGLNAAQSYQHLMNRFVRPVIGNSNHQRKFVLRSMMYRDTCNKEGVLIAYCRTFPNFRVKQISFVDFFFKFPFFLELIENINQHILSPNFVDPNLTWLSNLLKALRVYHTSYTFCDFKLSTLEFLTNFICIMTPTVS